MPGTKKCSKCGEQKECALFHKNRACSDGLHTTCKACILARKKARYEEHSEEIKAKIYSYRSADRDKYRDTQRRSYAKNRNKRRAEKAEWGRENQEEVKRRNAAWRAANRPYERNRQKERRESAKNNLRAVTLTDINRILSSPCMACGDSAVTLEHLIPLKRGGSHSIGNLAALCLSCNSSKQSMTWYEWKNSQRPRALLVFG